MFPSDVDVGRTRTTALVAGKVNVLQVLSIVLEHARIFETCTILKPGNVASEHTGSASLKPAHEDILAVTFSLVLHDR
jgi:hypothetical protein